jgi:hypothetical protein
VIYDFYVLLSQTYVSPLLYEMYTFTLQLPTFSSSTFVPITNHTPGKTLFFTMLCYKAIEVIAQYHEYHDMPVSDRAASNGNHHKYHVIYKGHQGGITIP